MKYTVYTYNIGGYEIIHQIPKECINPEIEYLYLTDDNSITSDTWKVIYVDDLTGSTFDKCYQLRFDPFRYASTDIVMRIDGSMVINKDLMPLFQRFEEGDYDAAMMIHPTRDNMYDEYVAWVQTRMYPIPEAEKALNFMASNGYDVKNYKGLFQGNFSIQRKNEIVMRSNAETYQVLKMLATAPDTVHRIDQTIWTFVLATHYPTIKIMPVGQYICHNEYFNWCMHGTDTPMVYNCAYDCDPYIFNKGVTIWYI